MTEVVIAHDYERNMELAFDTDDLDSVHSPCDIYDVTLEGAKAVHREIGARYVTLKFKPGKAAQWRKIKP